MKVLLFNILILSIFGCCGCYAQDAATLVKDINTAIATSAIGSQPGFKADLNDIVYFVADDGVHGKELWRTDGTEAGTSMVKDIYPGVNSSFIPELIVSNGTLFFPANDPEHGMELWKSDGSEQGTVLVADIFPGSLGSNPENLLALNDNAIFFTAFTQETGREPWRSNGEINGTFLIKDINQGSTGSDPATSVYVSGQVYFDAATTEYGRELWKSNGQVGSADLVVDSYPGSKGVEITSLTALDENIVFTTIVPDFYQGVRQTSFSWGKLWVSNPANPLPEVIVDFAKNGYGWYPTSFTYYDHKIYYTHSSPNDEYIKVLWKTDGTIAGTIPVEDTPEKTINAQGMVSYQGYLYLFSNKYGLASDFQMVKTDGTSQGTTLVKSTFNEFASTPEIKAIAVNDKLYIISTLGIWQSDGSEAETRLLTDKSATSYLASKDRLYLGIMPNNSGPELCFVDPVTSELKLVKDIRSSSEPDSSNPSFLSEYGGKLYFLADNNTYNGLYVSNGSQDGTTIAIDQTIDRFAVSGETTYFSKGANLYKKVSNQITLIKVFPTTSANQTVSVFEIIPFKGLALIVVKIQRTIHPSVISAQLWRSDGTEAGTYFIDDIYQSSRFVNYSLRVFSDNLFFSNSNGLTKTDGTLEGTHLVKDVFPSASGARMAEMNGNLYFVAADEELWRTDGTAANTFRVKDIQPFESWTNYLTVVKSTLFFVADDGVTGPELWKTDGTEEGTVLIKDISSSNNEYTILDKIGPKQLSNINDTLYFSANDDVHGYELWKSDGTTDGTVLLKDLIPGPKSSSPHNIMGVNGKILFLANQFDDTQELWINNFIVYGDSKLWELNKDDAHVVAGDYLYTSDLMAIDTTVFFAAQSTTGRELWAYAVSKPKAALITDVEKELEKLYAYPNPTTGFITIALPGMQTNLQYNIIDMLGRVALSGTSDANDKLNVDLSTLPAGFYLFQFMAFQHTPVRVLKLK